ncbi:MAG: hypothetical protein HC817_02585 [Saprospiraceae bacterium]|nr:hypothetical protein [Saprospiraceae bacterium]
MGCEKEKLSVKPDELEPQKLEFTIEQKDEARDYFAKTLAKAVEQEDVQNFLKEEALKRLNGDYEVLYMMVKKTKLKNGKTFSEILQEVANKDLAKRDSKTTKDFFDSFLEKIDPSLTIYLYAPRTKSVKRLESENYQGLLPFAYLTMMIKNRCLLINTTQKGKKVKLMPNEIRLITILLLEEMKGTPLDLRRVMTSYRDAPVLLASAHSLEIILLLYPIIVSLQVAVVAAREEIVMNLSY